MCVCVCVRARARVRIYDYNDKNSRDKVALSKTLKADNTLAPGLLYIVE